MIRKEGQVYPADEVLLFIGGQEVYGNEKPIKDWDGDLIKMNSVRLRTFKEKGCKCVACGIDGTVFMKDKCADSERWHFNLYAVVNGEYVLMTKDHIKAASLGGGNGVSNMQTMCTLCNAEKGNMTTNHWTEHLLAKRLLKALVDIELLEGSHIASKVLKENSAIFEKLGLTTA